MNTPQFVKALKSYRSANVFNPYRDHCDTYDKRAAAAIRSANLAETLDAFLHSGVDALWLGRDLGHRGGRRTGLALTDEVHLGEASRKWGVTLRQATKGEPVAERTAASVWGVARDIKHNIFLWNVFPFHPYEAGQPLSNRKHTARERDDGTEILEALVSLLRPSSIVAIGNDAFHCAGKLFPERRVVKVRHPSYGGEKDFFHQVQQLYRG